MTEPSSGEPAGAPAAHRVEALEHQVDELTSQLVEVQRDSTRRRRWRQLLTATMVVATCIALFASVIGVWVHSRVYDTDNWVAMVGDLPQDPEVAAALAAELTEQLMEAIDAKTLVADVLPEKASVLAGPISDGIGRLVDDALVGVISSDQFHDIWTEVNRIAHEAIVALLSGDPGRVQLTDGTVELNLLPLLAKALEVVDGIAPGLLGDGRPVPGITPETPTDEARAQLSEYLGRSLPEGFGSIAVFSSDKLAAAQRGFELFAKTVWFAVGLTLVLGVLTVWLARNRRIALIELGVGALVALAVAWSIIKMLVAQVVEQIADPKVHGAVQSTVLTVAQSLQSIVRSVMIVGAIVAVVAFLAGPSRPATWLRRQIRSLGGSARDAGGKAIGATGQADWIAQNGTALRVGVLFVGIGLLLVAPLSWLTFIAVVAAVGLIEAGLSAVGGPGAIEEAVEPPTER